MPRLQVANRATTTLSGNIADDAVSLTLTDSSLFPSAPFRITIGSEIIEVGAINKTTHVASSLLRGQEDTDAAAHLNGAAVTNRWTKGAVEELADDADLTTHAALTTAHGAVSAATASKMVVRDSSGRAAFAAPSAAGDAAILSTVTTHAALTAAGTHGSASAATASTLMHRDAAGRAKVVAPSAEDDIALKSNVTTVAGDLTAHAALTTAHGAVSAATASKMVVRDVSGRAAFADGAAAGDAVNKGQLDTKEATITAGTTAQYWRGDKSWATFLGETSATAHRGDHGKTAYDYSQVGHVPLTRTVSTTTPLAGGGALSGNLTLTHSDAAGYKHIPTGGAAEQYLKYSASGTAVWAAIAGGLELGETSVTAYRGDRGATAYTHSQAVTGAEHGAVSAATANMIARRDASARLAVANGSAAGDAVNKGQLDLKLDLAGGTLSGEVVFADQLATRPKLKDYSETTVVANTGANYAINLESGNVFELTLTAGCTFTFTNPPASGTAGSFTLILKQDATGSRTTAWPASVKWAAGTAPTLTTTASAIDVLTFLTTTAGTVWYGMLAGAAFATPA